MWQIMAKRQYLWSTYDHPISPVPHHSGGALRRTHSVLPRTRRQSSSGTADHCRGLRNLGATVTAGTTTIGLDIGGTKISAAVVDHEGNLLCKPLVTPTPAKEGARAIVETTIDLARSARDRVTNELGELMVGAVGLGSGGVFDDQGVVTSATDLLSGWVGTPVASWLSKGLGIPAYVINDVHAAAVGEALCGEARHYARVFVVAVGTGIGGGLIRLGKLDIGPAGIAGSIGHIPVVTTTPRLCSCGLMGHLEAYSSGPAIERAYRDLVSQKGEAKDQTLTLRDIATLSEEGDPIAGAVILDAAQVLGQGIAAAVNLLDPDCVVIGGGVANLGSALFQPAAEAYRHCVLPPAREVPLVPAALGTNAAIIGAALASRTLL